VWKGLNIKHLHGNVLGESPVYRWPKTQPGEFLTVERGISPTEETAFTRNNRVHDTSVSHCDFNHIFPYSFYNTHDFMTWSIRVREEE